MNLANVARTDLVRGNVVVLPGQLQTTMLLDARLSLLADAPRPLSHNTQVDFYNGSQEVSARIRLLDTNELQPGKSGWVQLRLNQPVVVARRDRFIVRIPSPSMTIGGGEVIDVAPRYHRRFQKPVLDGLERIAHGAPDELVLAVLERRSAVRATPKGGNPSTAKTSSVQPGCTLEEIVKQSNLALDVTQETLETLLTTGRVCKVGAYWFAQQNWNMLVEEAMRLIREHQQTYPLRSGLSKEEWRARLNLAPKMAAEVFAALQGAGQLQLVVAGPADTTGKESQVEVFTHPGGLIRTPDFQPRFTREQQRQVEHLLQHFHTNPYTPPVRSEAEAMVGAEVVNALIEQGRIVKLGEGILFLRSIYDEVLSKIVVYLRENGKMTVAEARDVTGTTRKYILPLLEHFDVLRVTRRQGDERVLGTAQIDQLMLH
jgi:selenocysteine-specific elongation factor